MTNKIYGTSGDDSLTGTTGSDEIITYAGSDTVRAGDGDDYINSNETTLWKNTGQLIAYGGSGNDKINGTDDGDDSLYGEQGDDTLYGRAGDDTLDGGAGDDYISAGTGSDLIYGREGNDEIYTAGSDATVYGGDGDDLINTTETSYYTTSTGTLIAYGELGNDRIRGGGSGSNQLYGGAGDDYLRGHDWNDTLDGGAGDDDLYGGIGDDTLDGGSGEDNLYGQSGDDTLDGGAGDDYISAGTGSDLIYGREGNDEIYTAGSDATVYGGDGDDLINTTETSYYTTSTGTLIAYGELGNDRIRGGGSGSNQLYGGAGDDYLRGHDWNDTLDGGAGDDDLYGGTGDDTLDGGAGDDSLYGNGGDDLLVYASGNDVLDGGSGSDTVEFSFTFREFLSELNIEGKYNGTISLTASVNEFIIKIDNIENFKFSDGSKNSYDIIYSGEKNSYLKDYYLKPVSEKSTILEEFSNKYFTPYVGNFLGKDSDILVHYPLDKVFDTGRNLAGDYVFTAISEQLKNSSQDVLEYISRFTKFSFSETSQFTASDISIEKHEMTAGGYYQALIGPDRIAISSTSSETSSISTFTHEIGHALGLDHPNEYVIQRDENGSFSGWELPDQLNIPLYLDNRHMSVMTYRQGALGFYGNDKTISLGPLDIAYLSKYGSGPVQDSYYQIYLGNESERTSVVFDSQTMFIKQPMGKNPFTLADSGGYDVIDLTQIPNDEILAIDLNIGFVGTELSTINGGLYATKAFLELYPESKFEKIIGHDGVDHVLIGAQEIHIETLAGDDIFYVREMSGSTVDGGLGDDFIYFNGNFSAYSLKNNESEIEISRHDEVLVLLSIDRLIFSDRGIAYNLEGDVGFSVKLLGAFLGKAESQNPASIGLVMQYLGNGYSEEEILQLAVEYVYGERPAITSVIEGLYSNVHGEAAPSSVMSELTADFDSGSSTAISIASQFVESQQNIEMIDLIGLSNTGVEYLIG